VLLAGCGDDNPTGSDGVPIPQRFRVLGEARAQLPGSISLECFIDVQVELGVEPQREGDVVEYTGSHGGHVGRSLTPEEGFGVAFDALVAGDARARLLPRDSVELVFPANIGVENRFWRELAVLAGKLTEDGHGSGTWSCQPLDSTSPGYVDTTGVATGTWRIESLDGGS
jgi:hypothetical protein